MSKVSIVLYTDGGCKPNPGVGGYGAFGYAYEEENDLTKGNTPTNYYITNKGFLTKDELAKNKAVKVSPTFYFIVKGAIGDATNNIAEAYAWIETMIHLRDEVANGLEISNIYTKTDSEYFIYLMNKYKEMKNLDGYFPSEVKTERSKELLKLIYDVRSELEKSGITFSISHVKGHSTSFGNNIVDNIATMSIMNYISGRDRSGTTFVKMDGKTFWDNKFIINSYFRFKQLIFETNQEHFIKINDQLFKGYIVFDYNKEKEVGERTNENIYGMIFTRKDAGVVEDIKNFYKTYDKRYYSCCTIDVGSVNHHSIASFYEAFGDLIFTLPGENYTGNVRTFFKGNPIIYNLNSGALCKMAINKTTGLTDILTTFLGKAYNDNMTAIDITDIIYDRSSKKYKLILDRNGKDMEVKNPFGKRPIVLAYGSDIPNIPWMSNVVQYEPIVNLFVIKNGSTIKYYTIFQMNDETVCIFCNFYSGITFL